MKKQLINKTISALGLLLAGLSFAQSTTENFVQSKSCLNDDCSKKAETITYFDGLGRPKQVIMVKSTVSGKDLVTPITYDGFGRQVKDILPVPVATQNSMIHTGIINENQANSYYGVSNAYAEKDLEKSPLDRVLQQANAGEAWKMSSGHTQKFTYEANLGTEVKKFVTNTSINTVNAISNTVSVPSVSTSNNGNYPAGTLYKNTVTDEDGNPVVQFTNAQGQTLLIRRTDGNQNIDTYYVYNEYNQLAFVMSPKAVKQIEANNKVITEAILNDLCYQYKYDGKTRLVEKKLPGKDWEFMVYDKQDRLVLMQDGILRTTTNNFLSKGWIFTKYDELGRVAYTGFFTNSATRQAMQTAVNTIPANASNNEKRSNSPFNLQGIDVYYDKKGFPTESITLLTVNYYDTYPSSAPAVPATVLGQYTLPQTLGNNQDASTKSLSTASFVKNIEDNNWTKTYHYYDSKGRLIASKSTNHLGGYTNREMKLDFTGAITESYTSHKRSPNDTEVNVKEKFVYDDQKRLVKQYHQVDNNPEELLAENTYNDLNELINKKTGNNLQSIDYAYNIRGWMTSMNNPDNLGTDLFGYKIKYENPVYTNMALGKYNGNISEVDWATSKDGVLKRYSYQYDALNRLKLGNYSEPNTSIPQNNYYNESMSYDVNGNIMALKRNRKLENVGVQLIDDLSCVYSGNRLHTVTDASSNYFGYPGVSGNLIHYDVNGNMTDHLDKGLLEIKYNYLHLPTYIKFDQFVIREDLFGQGLATKYKNTSYLYRADGVKLKKIHHYFSGRMQVDADTTTEYLDGFQYSGESDEFSLKNVSLQFVPTSEGYYDFAKNKYIYQYKDQIGNIRLAYYRDNNSGVAIDRTTDYYPFGLEFGGSLNTSGSLSPKYTYGFQEQEKQQDTGWNSFKWRNYDPTIGRFFNVDPLSEKYNTWSVYVFSGNRVIDARELEGLEPLKINNTTKNLVIVNQGWIANPNNGATQAQNFAKTNKDGGIDYSGIGIINNLNSTKNQVGVFASSTGDITKNDILSSINSFRKQSPDGKLIMVGHSMGADNLIELANENPNVKVDLLFTLDIADDPRYGIDDDKIPSNVKTAINYYNKNDGFMHSAIGGEDIEAIDSSKTKILNVPVNASHTQIDNKYRYNAYNAVVKELNKPEEKNKP